MRNTRRQPRESADALTRSVATPRPALHCIGLVVAALLLALAPMPATATTVVAKGIPELSREADKIFMATVSAVRSQWTDSARTGIETLVTFAAPTMLFGTDDGDEIILRFGGGAVDGIREEFLGAPRFAVGDRVVIFAQDGYWVSPVVGFNQGCFRIEESADGPVVFTADRLPVTTLTEAPMAVGNAATAAVPVTLDAFLARVRDELTAQGRDGTR